MDNFTVLVTADAFRASAAEAERPLVEAGARILYPTRMGPLPAEELLPWLQQADAVVAANDPYFRAVLDACPRLRVIARWGTGYDQVDVAACTQTGVVACNAPGQNVQAVADYVFLMLLALARRLPHQLRVMRTGGWEEVRGVELFQKTLGIVGLGAIGKAVARRARGFECRILAYDPYMDPAATRDLGVALTDLETLFGTADYITLHATLTPETTGLVSASLLAQMKPTAFLVNAARGPIVDEAALLQVLTAGRIAGAALDAYCTEPLPADHPFRGLPNCLCTPHSAFNTEETAAAVNRLVAQQILAVRCGDVPAGVLNPDVFRTAAFAARAAPR